jgi:hypothetical protein
MKVFNTNTLLDELKAITVLNENYVQNKIYHLNDNQLNWRPNTSSWNTLEILAHLNEYAKFYNKVLSDKIEKTKFKDPKENFTSSPLGRSAWKSMKLGNARNVKRKFKAPKNYNPTFYPELVSPQATEIFVTNQSRLTEILEKAKNVNLRKVKVPISISKIVRLRLGDALMFVVYHNERHIEQLKTLLKHPNFPKKK